MHICRILILLGPVVGLQHLCLKFRGSQAWLDIVVAAFASPCGLVGWIGVELLDRHQSVLLLLVLVASA